MYLYAVVSVMSREAIEAASTSPILPQLGLSSALAKVPTERKRHVKRSIERSSILFGAQQSSSSSSENFSSADGSSRTSGILTH